MAEHHREIDSERKKTALAMAGEGFEGNLRAAESWRAVDLPDITDRLREGQNDRGVGVVFSHA